MLPGHCGCFMRKFQPKVHPRPSVVSFRSNNVDPIISTKWWTVLSKEKRERRQENVGCVSDDFKNSNYCEHMSAIWLHWHSTGYLLSAWIHYGWKGTRGQILLKWWLLPFLQELHLQTTGCAFQLGPADREVPKKNLQFISRSSESFAFWVTQLAFKTWTRNQGGHWRTINTHLAMLRLQQIVDQQTEPFKLGWMWRWWIWRSHPPW